MSLSRSAIRKLGERLRDADNPHPEDIALLGEALIRYNGSLSQVASGLHSIGLSPTVRIKSSGTIVDKLQRTRHLHLTTIQDLAGARVVKRMTLDEQDRIAEQIQQLWPARDPIDRRASPSFGYRAVHIVPTVDGCLVEIQLRTLYQDTWAQVMEWLADQWGRSIRYGGPPDEPDEPFGTTTRAGFVEVWIQLSDAFHAVANLENSLARLVAKGTLTLEEQVVKGQLQTRLEQDFSDMRLRIRELARRFSTAGEALG